MENLNTLAGVFFPLFINMYLMTRLTKIRREAKAWGDEGLIDIVADAEQLEVELQAEKKRMDELVQGEWLGIGHDFG